MAEIQERRRWLRSEEDASRLDPSCRGTREAAHAPTQACEAQAGTVISADRALHRPAVEPLLLTTVQVSTMRGGNILTRASGFFYRSSRSLFLVTSRHVLFDPASGHFPDAIGFNVHTDARNLALSAPVRLPLYCNGLGTWRQGRDCGGNVDVAVLEVPRDGLPRSTVLHAFAQEHLLSTFTSADAGLAVLLVGFPLGFHDTLHHLPVVRHAIIASSFGLRFQGLGCFLTDGRAHRGSSGAPVVIRSDIPGSAFPWRLLGVHSSRFDMGDRDLSQDESLGLNCAWYADILRPLTS